MTTMKRLTHPEALAHLDKRMIDTFGVGYVEYDAGIAASLVPTAYLSAAIRLTDNSGIIEKLTKWDSERRKSNAGKKALIPLRALVVLYLLNTQMGLGVTYKELARTLAHRFAPKHFAALGIGVTSGDTLHWYKRVSDTTYRLIELMNPRPATLNKTLNAKEYEELLNTSAVPSSQALAMRNQVRLDTFCRLLVEASYRHLPDDVRQRYRGNIAIDATKTQIRGRRNSASKLGSRSNPDAYAGRYMREGSHGGAGAATDEAAYELETAVMIWNKPGENAMFPSLITEISCHNPGEFVGHAANLTAHHQKLGFNQVTAIVDRAYNYERIETFHLPMARLGVELVFDYKAEDLGLQSHFSDLILVDGSWYVNWMPKSLIEASRKVAATEAARDEAKIVVYKTEHPTKRKGPSFEDVQTAMRNLADSEEALPNLQRNIDAREPYRMIPKGRRDADGYQRFSYPPLNKMLVQPKVAPKVTSLTIPPTLPINDAVASGKRSGRKAATEDTADAHTKRQPIKFGQHLPHKTVEWRRQYGMRSLVESSNNLLKTVPHGDIGNPKKRSGRGYAALYLTLTFSVVTSNLRRIATFFKAEAHRLEDASSGLVAKHRTRRRHDALGAPLVQSDCESPPRQTA